MSKPTMEQLLADARAAMSPSANDSERVFRSVIAASSGPVVSATSSSSSLLKVVLPLVLLTGAGAFLFLKTSESVSPEQCRKLPALTLSSVRQSESQPPIPELPTASPAEPPLRTPVPAVTGKPHRSASPVAVDDDNSILGELKLIQRATAALNRRAPQEAGVALDEHRRRFPSGVMAQEREGLKIVAMCQRNETEKARKAHEKFQRRSPDAPIHVRITNECGF